MWYSIIMKSIIDSHWNRYPYFPTSFFIVCNTIYTATTNMVAGNRLEQGQILYNVISNHVLQ